MPGFLLPDEDQASFGSTGMLLDQDESMTRQHQQHAAGAVKGGNILGVIGGSLALAVPDFVDTVSSSVGLTERGELVDKTLRGAGSPGLMQFYNENKGAIEVGSGIAGIIASDYLGGRILKSTKVVRALSKIPVAKRVATLDDVYERSLRSVRIADMVNAGRARMGPEQFAGQITLPSLGRPAISVDRNALVRGARWTGVGKGLVRNATTEAILAAGMNQNSFLFSEDMGENLLWMGAGLGLGAGIDRMMTSYTIRKFANSDSVARRFAGALDPEGFESARLKSAIDDEPDKDLSWLGYMSGHFTDRATSLMTSVRTLQNRELTQFTDLARERDRFGTQHITLARDEMQKATTRGIKGVPNTAFSMKTPGLGNHVDMKLHDDPASFYGVEAIGAPNKENNISAIHDKYTSGITARQEQIRKYLVDGGKWVNKKSKDPKTGETITERVLKPLSESKLEAYRTEFKQLVFQQSLTPMVSLGKEWVPLQVGKILDGFEEPKIKISKSDDLKLWEVDDPDLKIGFSNDGELTLPRGKTVNNLDFYDHLRLYRTAQVALDDMVANQTKLSLPKEPNWFQLDMAEQLIQRTGNEGLVAYPAGMTRQTAQVESLKQKVIALEKLKPSRLLDSNNMAKARMQFNLPTLSAYEAGQLGTDEHPIDTLLRGLNSHNIDTLTYTDILKGIQDVKKINGITENAKDKVESLVGDMFNFLRDGEGKPITPILAYKRPFAPHEWTKEDLAERIAMRKALVRRTLVDPNSAPITRNLVNMVLNDPDFYQSSQVQALLDVQLQSFLPGFSTAAPQTKRGQLLGMVESREWRDRDNPVLLAAGRIRDKVDRLVRDMMKNQIETTMGDVLNRVNGPRNQQTRLLLNQYLSHRSGWDLEKDLVPTQLPGGVPAYQFKLDPKSVHNRTRWQKQFNEAMPEYATLRSPQGKPIVLDELGKEFLTRFNLNSDAIIDMKNTALRSQGLGKIKKQIHYSPPPNIKGKIVGFTLDAERNPVPGGTIIADTPEEFSKLKTAMEMDPDSPLGKNGNIFRTQEELRDFATIWDKAQMNFIDPGTTAIQPGRRAAGTLTGQVINPNAIEDAMTWARDAYLQHADDVMRILTKDQINAAETRAQIARGSGDKTRSIYDFYIENITGRMTSASQASPVGRLRRGAEDWIQGIIDELTPHVRRGFGSGAEAAKPHVSRVWKAVSDWATHTSPVEAVGSEKHKAFVKLRDSLGEYMPFKDAAEMTERLHGAKRPPELETITGNLSKFEAAMRLRIFEVIHPVMNLTGIINAMPSVVRNAQPVAGESADDFARRVGHSAQIFNLPDGKQIGIVDSARLLQRAFKRAWSREAHEDYAYMQGHGYITQEVAEFQRQYGAINSRGAWKKAFLGDPISDSKFERGGGLVGWISVLSDRSEDFSRSWGHMVGLELADFLQIPTREAKHSFAHDIANKMIANYDPKNRPEIFQGALGAPIGLFQSFIWNYYQRLFRYIEAGDLRSAATQYATQASLFGVTTLPGWSAVNKLFFDHSDGENSPYDAIYDRFGTEAGDLLMGGTLSSLPKIANMLPGNQGIPGIDLYSRGDTNIRLPVVNMPLFDTIKRVTTAIGQGLGAFKSSNPNLSDNQLAEIAANMISNRPIAGFIEQALSDGFDTDNYGQVAAETQGISESIYRIMGGRSMRQSKELEAFYSNKNAQELQNAKMSDLRLSVRAALRDGNPDVIPSYFDQYVLNGGDPKYFKRWVKSNYDAAVNTRAERMLDDLMGNPEKWKLTERLLDAEVSIPDSELNPDAYQVEALPADINPDMPEGMMNPAISEEVLDDMETNNLYSSRF